MSNLGKAATALALFSFALLPASWAQDGAALYKSKCAMCHGATGEGKPAMKAPAIAGKSDTDVTKAITTNPKHAALKKSLSEAQIKDVATYVSSLKK